MIDLRLVRENPDLVRASQRARGADESVVDALLAADVARREAARRGDDLRAEQKAASQAVKKATPEERPAVLERAKALAAEVKQAEEAQREADAALREVHLRIPNVVHGDVPPYETCQVCSDEFAQRTSARPSPSKSPSWSSSPLASAAPLILVQDVTPPQETRQEPSGAGQKTSLFPSPSKSANWNRLVSTCPWARLRQFDTPPSEAHHWPLGLP